MQTKLLSGNKRRNRAADTQQTLAVGLLFFLFEAVHLQDVHQIRSVLVSSAT